MALSHLKLRSPQHERHTHIYYHIVFQHLSTEKHHRQCDEETIITDTNDSFSVLTKHAPTCVFGSLLLSQIVKLHP